MKKMIMVCIFVLFSGSCYAGDWTKEDTYRQLAYTAFHAADWAQSLEIASNDDFYERNFILGKHPSEGRVNTYFAATLITNMAISYFLPQKYRKWWQYGTMAIEIGCVANNYSIGIRVW